MFGGRDETPVLLCSYKKKKLHKVQSTIHLPATIYQHSENGIRVNMAELEVFGVARSRTYIQRKKFDHLYKKQVWTWIRNLDAMKYGALTSMCFNIEFVTWKLVNFRTS